MDDDRIELLGQVASWYYEDGLDQSVIAKKVGRSPSMISRMLQEARELGFVEIKVRYPLKRDTELETHFSQVFNLSQAYILADPPVHDYPTLLRRLGRLGAYYLRELLHDNIIIGIGWGASLHQLVKAMPNLPLENARVIQIMGSAGHGDPMIDGAELARWLSEKLSADYFSLPAPLFVESEAVAQSLHHENLIKKTLSLANQAEIALVGIGPIDSSFSGLYRTGYFNGSDIEDFKAMGVVGDLIGNLLDAKGNVVDIPVNRCIVGQDLTSLRSVPTVIAVAGDIMKSQVILAALQTGCLDILVTDAVTAQAVMALAHKQL